MPDIVAKQRVVEDIKAKFQNAKSVVLADYRGLTVAEATELRANLRASQVEYRVLKNTMVTRAVRELGYEGLVPHLKGPTAVAFCADPVAPAKLLVEFAGKHKQLVIKAGVVEGDIITAKEVMALAELPSREQLLGKVAGLIQAPLSRWANCLQSPLRKMGYALNELNRVKNA
ncbi:MAG: 50S ribosomal protein L10 [Gracilibacteraceae bacterium]|jgi:large subunit ribosomal protein L10|nr:50S ribosomal protein L10 [Gracilibacteraceae bacterium]